jgi:hypothetical protein
MPQLSPITNIDRKEFINTARLNWAQHSQTQDYLKELESIKQKLFSDTMNLSIHSPPDTHAIVRNMIQAKTIQNTIDKITKGIIT